MMQTKKTDNVVLRHDADGRTAETRLLTRRQLLGASAGAGLTAALLGGGALPAGTMARAVRAQDGGSELHVAWPYQAPPQGHFNYFIPDVILGPLPNIYGDLMMLPLAMYYWASGEWLPLLATEWSFIQTGAGGGATASASPGALPEGTPAGALVPSPLASPVTTTDAPPVASPATGGSADTLQVKLRQGVVWSDGTEFNADDVVATYNILRLQQDVVWDYLSSVDVVDPYTINFVVGAVVQGTIIYVCWRFRESNKKNQAGKVEAAHK